jgi:DNA gyrase/topoisomerase IV subunit A
MPSVESHSARIRELEALEEAIARWDDISTALRGCSDRDEVRRVLTEEFGFGPDTREHVLNLQLGMLTEKFRRQVKAELAAHKEAIADGAVDQCLPSPGSGSAADPHAPGGRSTAQGRPEPRQES